MNTTRNVLTKFECPKVIGERAMQISQGADLYIDPQGESDPATIAWMEVRNRKLPWQIERRLPDGTVETFDLRRMHISF